MTSVFLFQLQIYCNCIFRFTLNSELFPVHVMDSLKCHITTHVSTQLFFHWLGLKFILSIQETLRIFYSN